MWQELGVAKNKISKTVIEETHNTPRAKLDIDRQVLAKLEKLRRGTD